jgi:hypothetical protein
MREDIFELGDRHFTYTLAANHLANASIKHRGVYGLFRRCDNSASFKAPEKCQCLEFGVSGGC